MTIRLIRPTVELRDSYLGAIEEHREERLYAFLDPQELKENFEGYVQSLLLTVPDNPRLVAQTVYWGVDEDGYAGRIALRHSLNEGLMKLGGHIGYDVRPSKRRRGYAVQMLRLVLEEAKALGLERVLITCDEDNVGSYRTAEGAGAVLEKTCTVEGHSKPVRYYWIDLAGGPATSSGETR